VAVLRRQSVRATSGAGAAFLLLGGWLCCFHFMYYDVLLAYLPVMLLMSHPARYVRRAPERGTVPGGELAVYLPWPWGKGWLVNPVPMLIVPLLAGFENPLRAVFFDEGYMPPIDTWILIGVWVWCAWVVLAPARLACVSRNRKPAPVTLSP
jgi:hypothetical protein